MTPQEILSLLKNVKRSGKGYSAQCPSHADAQNSLVVKAGTRKTFLDCYAKVCSEDDICAALGITPQDLYFEAYQDQQSNGKRPHGSNTAQRIVAVYQYTDEHGNLLYENVRFEPKDFRQRRFDESGKEIRNLDGIRRVPYRLPELINALREKPARFVLLTEGEKDCDNVRGLGFIASSFKKWQPEFNQFITGANVVLLVDHDRSGVKQAHDAARTIQEAAAGVRVVDLYDSEPLPDKRGRDVSDWLETHFKDELVEIIRSAPLWNPNDERAEPEAEQTKQPLSVVRVFDAETKPIDYLWKPRIVRGMLTMISGAEGIGKSWLTCVFAAGISTGGGFPVIDENGKLSFEKCEPGKVLMLSAEDSLSQIIKPRLEAVGADTKQIYVIDEPFTFDEKGLLKLRALILDIKPDLVIIDPLFAFTPAKTDINAANQSRAISKELAAIAEESNAALVPVRHIGKAKGNGDSRAAGLGSIDWRAAVRSELIVGTNPENEAERVICHDKCNYAPKAEAISYTIENTPEGAQFRWLGKSNLTASALLGNVKSDDERAEQTDAVEFLKDALGKRERDSDEVKSEAEKHGITPKQLRTARISLGMTFKNGIRGEGFGKGKKTFWSLPSTEECINALSQEKDSINAHKIEEGHLWANGSNKTSYSNSLPINALSQEKGTYGGENGHSRAFMEVRTVKDAAGVKLFDSSPDEPRQTFSRAGNAPRDVQTKIRFARTANRI